MYAVDKNSQNRTDTADRITAAIGLRQHIKRNYVPWALTNLALAQLDQHLAESSRIRLFTIKKECRRMRQLLKDYRRRASDYCGSSISEMSALMQDFDRHTASAQGFTQLKAREDALNDEDCLEPEQGLHAALAYDLLEMALAIDDDTDRVLTQVMGVSVHRKREPEITELRKILKDFRRRGYAPVLSKECRQWLRQLAIAADCRANELIDGFYSESKTTPLEPSMPIESVYQSIINASA